MSKRDATLLGQADPAEPGVGEAALPGVGQAVVRSPAALGLRPLTARSVILSVLLGSHPPLLPVRSLVRTTELFGITEGTTRVALSRLVADGDVLTHGGTYRLSDRLLARQRRQDEGRLPATRRWRGTWEIGVVSPDVHAATDRGGVRSDLLALKLAEMRPGVWARPANLLRTWAGPLRGQVWQFEARLDQADGPDDRSLAGRLWDLEGWAARASALLSAQSATKDLGGRFVIAAAIIRHVQEDPLLPAALLPDGWPGTGLRRAYADYERELRSLLRSGRGGQDGADPPGLASGRQAHPEANARHRAK